MSVITLPRDRIIGARVTRIGHSNYSTPEFAIEGIGPASFRSHFIALDSGVVLDLFTAEISTSVESMMTMSGETQGIPVQELIGRQVTALVRDDVYSSLVILENHIYLRDANDGVYGNPLLAGFLTDYSDEARSQFIDYWTEARIHSFAN